MSYFDRENNRTMRQYERDQKTDAQINLSRQTIAERSASLEVIKNFEKRINLYPESDWIIDKRSLSNKIKTTIEGSALTRQHDMYVADVYVDAEEISGSAQYDVNRSFLRSHYETYGGGVTGYSVSSTSSGYSISENRASEDRGILYSIEHETQKGYVNNYVYAKPVKKGKANEVIEKEQKLKEYNLSSYIVCKSGGKEIIEQVKKTRFFGLNFYFSLWIMALCNIAICAFTFLHEMMTLFQIVENDNPTAYETMEKMFPISFLRNIMQITQIELVIFIFVGTIVFCFVLAMIFHHLHYKETKNRKHLDPDKYGFRFGIIPMPGGFINAYMQTKWKGKRLPAKIILAILPFLLKLLCGLQVNNIDFTKTNIIDHIGSSIVVPFVILLIVSTVEWIRTTAGVCRNVFGTLHDRRMLTQTEKRMQIFLENADIRRIDTLVEEIRSYTQKRREVTQQKSMPTNRLGG